MKNKIIFASVFLSLALVVGSVGSVFANEVVPADNQPAATNEAEQPIENSEAQPAESTEQPATTNEEAQPAENAEKPAENNEGATTDNKESAEYKYEVRFIEVHWSGVKGDGMGGITFAIFETNNPADIAHHNITLLNMEIINEHVVYSSDRYVGSQYKVNEETGQIIIRHVFIPE